MFAITSSGWRSIADVSDLQPGETVADVIPASLLTTLQGAELRRQRDAMLAACDWTQAADSPLDATTKAAWVAYRQSLRDVPAQTNFPDSINWPVQP